MHPRRTLSLSNFFATAHFYLIIYILTPFLSTLMPQDTSALAVALGAIITLSIFPSLPRLVVRYGPQRLGMVLGALEGLVLLFLSLAHSPLIAIALVALAVAFPPLITYQLDLLLEASIQDERSTGRARTAFNTAGNIGLILAPMLVGLLLDSGNQYGRVFFVAALSLVPFILLMLARSLPRVHPPNLKSLRNTGFDIFSNRDRRASAFSNLTLQFLFHIVPLYVPLYLHASLGIPWSSLGPILGISLIPFVFEYPAGWLADTRLGDATLLSIGFTVVGLAFASLSLIHAGTPIAVIIVLMITMRIGSALVEAMTDAHFFRRVSGDDIEAVSIYRMMRPLGALTAPIVGSILLSAGSYSSLFIICGAGMLIAGLACARVIRSGQDGNVLKVMEYRKPFVGRTRC